MARVERPEIGTEMYAVFEHIYSVQNRAGPLLEYCVCKGTVRGFFTGGYTEVRLLFTGPDGFPQPGYYKLDDIGKKLFYTAAEAAALAKSMTEKYERTWGWIGAPEIPMARPWEKLLEVPANGYFYPRPPRGGRQQKQRQNLYFQTNYTTFCTNLEEP